MVLIITGALLGRKQLPGSGRAWWALLQQSAPRFGIVGVTVVFAFAGANALAATGLPQQMTALLNGLNLPLWLLAILIGLIVIAVAAPLSATATMAAVGTVGVATLVAAGVPATTAAVAVLVFSSCEAAVPAGRCAVVCRLWHRGRGSGQDLRPPAHPLRPAAAGHRRADHLSASCRSKGIMTMHQIRRAIDVIFVLTLAALLSGGVLFVAGQAIALIAGQGDWLVFFNESIKTPMCIAASMCAIAGFLLNYKRHAEAKTDSPEGNDAMTIPRNPEATRPSPNFSNGRARSPARRGGSFPNRTAERRPSSAQDAVLEARDCIRSGVVFGLDYPADAFDPGMSLKRTAPRHTIYSSHPAHRDDYLDGYYLQGSTQIDGLRHRRADDIGFYNGTPDDQIREGTAEPRHPGMGGAPHCRQGSAR